MKLQKLGTEGTLVLLMMQTRGGHSTEIAYALLTQQPLARI